MCPSRFLKALTASLARLHLGLLSVRITSSRAAGSLFRLFFVVRPRDYIVIHCFLEMAEPERFSLVYEGSPLVDTVVETLLPGVQAKNITIQYKYIKCSTA